MEYSLKVLKECKVIIKVQRILFHGFTTAIEITGTSRIAQILPASIFCRDCASNNHLCCDLRLMPVSFCGKQFSCQNGKSNPLISVYQTSLVWFSFFVGFCSLHHFCHGIFSMFTVGFRLLGLMNASASWMDWQEVDWTACSVVRLCPIC